MMYYQDMFQEFQIKNLDSLEKCDKILALFNQKEMQYKLIIDLLHQKAKKENILSEEIDRQLDKLLKEHPIILQFQEEIYDLKKILQLKINQQKDDDIVIKSQKYMNELQDIFQKLDEQSGQKEIMNQLQENERKYIDQVQLLTLEKFQLEEKINQIDSDQKIFINQKNKEALAKIQEQNDNFQQQIKRLSIESQQQTNKYQITQEKLDSFQRLNEEKDLKILRYKDENDDLTRMNEQILIEKKAKFDENLSLKNTLQKLELKLKDIQEEKQNYEDQMNNEVKQQNQILQNQKSLNQRFVEQNQSQKQEIEQLYEERQQQKIDLNLKQTQLREKEENLQLLSQDLKNYKQSYQDCLQNLSLEQQKHNTSKNELMEHNNKMEKDLQEKQFLIDQLTKQLHEAILNDGKIQQECNDKLQTSSKEYESLSALYQVLQEKDFENQKAIHDKDLEIRQLRQIITNNSQEFENKDRNLDDLNVQIQNLELKQQNELENKMNQGIYNFFQLKLLS